VYKEYTPDLTRHTKAAPNGCGHFDWRLSEKEGGGGLPSRGVGVSSGWISGNIPRLSPAFRRPLPPRRMEVDSARAESLGLPGTIGGRSTKGESRGWRASESSYVTSSSYSTGLASDVLLHVDNTFQKVLLLDMQNISSDCSVF